MSILYFDTIYIINYYLICFIVICKIIRYNITKGMLDIIEKKYNKIYIYILKII